MSTSIAHAPRRMLAGLMAGALALTGVAFSATSASAVEDAERIEGETRVETAIEIATEAHDQVDDVVLATSAVAADSLPGNGLAGALDGALLLTEPDELNDNTAQALQDLGAENVWILGGTMAVSQDVEDELDDNYTVVRIGGENRSETSALIAERIVADDGGINADIGSAFGGDDTVIIARGDLPFDAVAGSALSYFGTHPILLTPPDELPESVNDALETIDADKAVILGGTAAVSADVEAEVEAATGTDATRVEGDDRNATAANLGTALIEAGVFDASRVFVTTGALPFDALTVGQLAGQEDNPSPILLTRGDELGEASTTFLQTYGDAIETLTILGGTNAVPEAVADAAIAATEEEIPGEDNQTFDVTPNDDVTITLATEPSTDDDRQYTVNNPVADTTHTIALFPADEVSVDDDGVVSFGDDEGDANEADDLGNVSADITVVNGAPQAADTQVATVMPSGGQITFTVDGDADETVVPVVFADADEEGDLDLDENDVATEAEAFGVGGAINYNPGEVATGAVAADEAITDLDEEDDFIITASGLYEYDDNDTFYIDENDNDTADLGEQVNIDGFEAELSVGDELSGGTQYNANDSFSSTIIIDDIAPGAPAVAATGAQGSVELNITLPANFDDDDTVVVERASVDVGVDATCGTADDVVGDYSNIATLTGDDDEDTADADLDYTDSVDAGCYSYQVTASVDGEETASAATAAAVAVTADTTAADLTAATPNDINNGVGSTNEVIVTFDEPVASIDASLFTVFPTAQTSLTIDVTSAAQLNDSGTTWTLTLEQSIDDASTDISYTVDAEAEAFEDAAGNVSAADSVTFMY